MGVRDIHSDVFLSYNSTNMKYLKDAREPRHLTEESVNPRSSDFKKAANNGRAAQRDHKVFLSNSDPR